MSQEISASPRVGLARQGDAIALSRNIGGKPTLIHVDAADYEAQVAGKAAARTEGAALSAQLAVGGVASDVAAAKVLITAGLAGSAPLNFRGYWDASTNTPDLTASDPIDGDLWVASKAGTIEIGGQKLWQIGDAAWFHEGGWVYYARAGWAAVAKTIHAIEAINAGSVQIQEGGEIGALEITDAVGNVIALIRPDGTYASGLEDDPRYGLTEQGVRAGSVQLLGEQGADGLSITDALGFVLAHLGQDGLIAGGAEGGAKYSLSAEGIRSGAIGLTDKGHDDALIIQDAEGFVFCSVGADGSFRSGGQAQPRFGITEDGVNAGDLKLLGTSGGEGFTLTDAFGFLIAQIGADGSFRSAAGAAPSFALAEDGMRAGAVQLTDGAQDDGLSILDAHGFMMCHIATDGAVRSDLSKTPRFGLLDGAIRAGSLSVVDDGEPDLWVTDGYGFLLQAPGSTGAVPDTNQPAQRPDPTQRGPEASDDASQGYAPGALWRYAQTAWRMLHADRDRAVWQRLTALPALAADRYASSLVAAWGTRRLVCDYAGPLVDVAVNTGSGVRVVSVGQDEGGCLSRIDLLRAASARGEPLCIVRFYDQSGKEQHATAPGYDAGAGTLQADRCPHIGVRWHDGNALASWACEPNPLQPVDLPATLKLSGGNATALFYGAFSGSNCPLYSTYQAFTLGRAEADCLGLTTGTGNESGRLTLTGGDPFAVINRSTLTPGIRHGALCLRLQPGDQATLDIQGAERMRSTVALAGGFSGRTLSGGAIGASPRRVGNSAAIQMSGLVLLDRSLTDAEIDRTLDDATVLEAVTPQLRERLDCIGSSTTQGFGIKDGWCWPQLLGDHLSRPLALRSWAVPGSTAKDFITYTIENVLADLGQMRAAYAVTWLGNNDIGQGFALDEIVRLNALIHARLRAAGYRRLFILGQFNAALNAKIYSAVSSGVIDADAFIDPWSAGPMANHGDRSLYGDGVHPTESGARYAASFIADHINKYL
ncbi:SGNH/GDSL hydrolase family protein [Asaia krungthepensis]|uniref:SGNH hydrolase-type esterase domain-containing protein n=1 Tax=Asaia krungthepensis NRIC 0535 TaxID=1307925 RepID=A0ABQ0Q376_9PROT|nr:SGNH/GDSL hydrolase family protein [Asaia krungthepensis]GBQ89259.1 hypothetical protein AA0535_1749 [Asaia krungthepensis NRIC 0535]